MWYKFNIKTNIKKLKLKNYKFVSIKNLKIMIFIIPFLFRKGFRGMAIYPFIFLKEHSLKEDIEVINHEKIHLRQQIELLWFFFFILYFSEYLIGLIKYRNSDKAYFNISFEKEAYYNQNDLGYLKSRKFWAFKNYF